MNFIDYCELPDNEEWITQFMWNMKEEGGFDSDAIIDAVCEQAMDEGTTLTDNPEDDYEVYFASWYDELDNTQDGPYPKSGAI